MRDWTEYVRNHLPAGRLRKDREDEVIADLAQQLEDFYQDALVEGASEPEARQHACRQVADWETLVRDIVDSSPGSRKAGIDRLCENAEAAGADKHISSLPHRLFSDLRQDLLHGIRILMKNRGFAAIAVITLALGIGINASVFSVVNAMMHMAGDFPDSSSLVFLWGTRNPDIRFGGVSSVDARDWQAQSRSFSEIGLFHTPAKTWTGGAEAERVYSLEADVCLLSMLGLRASVGRLYSAGDAAATADPVVVVSDSFWRTRLGADPGVLGQSLVIDGVHHTIIGVLEPMRRLMRITHFEVDFLTPFPPDSEEIKRGERPYRALARLRSGVPLDTAQAEMDGIAAGLAQAFPKTNAGTGVRLESLENRLVSPTDRLLGLVLIIAVAAVLMIACINLANMLLAKATTRTREIAIRLALGAGRMRIVRQLLTESLILALTGGALGFLLAYSAVGVFFTSMEGSPFTLEELRPDGAVLLYTLVVSLLTAAVFGLAPASMVSRVAVADSIKEGGAADGCGMSHNRFRNWLVIVELAIGLPLMVCCGLAVRNMQTLSTIDLGFNAENLITMNVDLPQYRYDSKEKWVAAYREVVARLEALPNTRAAGAILSFPVGGVHYRMGARARIEGRQDGSGEAAGYVSIQPVTPGYFRAMEIPLLLGRPFADQDTATSMPVAIINRRMALRYWHDSDGVGRTVTLDPGTKEERTITIVGVVGDSGRGILGQPVAPEMYVPHAQRPAQEMVLAVRTSEDPMLTVPDLKRAIREFDPNIPLYEIQTVPAIIHRWLRDDRTLAAFLGILAVLSLVLAAIGLYGIVAYSVTQRTHEIGVRMALGAESSRIVCMVIRQCLVLSLIGIGIGFLISLPVGLLMGSQLYGVSGVDPAAFSGASMLLLAVGLLAGYVPARGAARVDPMQALHHE